MNSGIGNNLSLRIDISRDRLCAAEVPSIIATCMEKTFDRVLPSIKDVDELRMIKRRIVDNLERSSQVFEEKLIANNILNKRKRERLALKKFEERETKRTKVDEFL